MLGEPWLVLHALKYRACTPAHERGVPECRRTLGRQNLALHQSAVIV